MECKFCSKEIDEGAVYCYYCGKRLDGKKPCPACGRLLPEDGIFCGRCGARVEPEPEPEKEEIEELLPETEENAEPLISEEVAAEPEAQAAALRPVKWRKAVEITKLSLAGFAAFIGIIFTFCIGVSLGTGSSVSLFDYFGKAYESLDSIAVSFNMDDTQSFALYMPALFGTLIAIAALICNFVFAIMTIISVVRQYAYKNEKADFVKPALKTYISFALFAAAFYAIHAASAHTLDGNHESVYFDNVTLSALIIGGVAFGGYFACRVVLRMSDFNDKKEIVNSCVALGTGIVATVVATLLTLTVCRFSNATGNQSLGFMEMIKASAYTSDSSNTSGVMSFGVFGYIIVITMLVLAISVITSAATRVGGGKIKSLAVAISLAIISLLYLGCAMITANLYTDVKDFADASISRTYGVPIATIVLSFIVLGGVIAQIALENNKRTA